MVGEELIYQIKWSFLNIGRLHIKVLAEEEINGNRRYWIQQEIKSNPALFFIRLDNKHVTCINDSFSPLQFNVSLAEDSSDYQADYRFDYQDSLLYLKMRKNNNAIFDTLRIKPRCYDGLGLIYYLRSASDSLFYRDTVWTISEDRVGRVAFTTTGKSELISIPGNASVLNTASIKGRFLIKGLAGLSGPFETWFSADENRLPVKTKMQVFIGSIELILEKWIPGDAFILADDGSQIPE